MGGVIIALLPLIVATVTVPIYTIVGLILLQSENGLKKAIALVVGAVTIRLLQGVLFGFTFGRVDEEYPEAGPDILVSILLLILGGLLLIKAYQAWRKEPDPEESLPRWMRAINQISIAKAAGIGALYVLTSPKQWLFTQSAIGTIIDAEVGPLAGTSLYLFFVVGTQITLLVPIVMIAIAPQPAAKPLNAAHDWLARHNQTILMVASLIFGAWFTFQGFDGLLT